MKYVMEEGGLTLELEIIGPPTEVLEQILSDIRSCARMRAEARAAGPLRAAAMLVRLGWIRWKMIVRKMRGEGF